MNTVGSAIILLIGLFFVFVNWLIVYSTYIKKEYSSWVPLLGGLFCIVGLGNLELGNMEKYWWIPLTIDYGCFPALIQMAWLFLFSKKKYIR